MKKSADFSSYPNKISLDVELLHEPKYPGSAFVVFDFDVQAIFGTKGRVPILMTIDGKVFRRSLARYAGEYMMVFNKELRDATGYQAGDVIHVLLERDNEERTVELPEDIQKALSDAGMLSSWEKKSYSFQKEHLAWLMDAKRAETKLTRITKLIALLQEA